MARVAYVRMHAIKFATYPKRNALFMPNSRQSITERDGSMQACELMLGSVWSLQVYAPPP